MKSCARVRRETFQPIELTVVFESVQEVDNFIAHNEDEYPKMCENLEGVEAGMGCGIP